MSKRLYLLLSLFIAGSVQAAPETRLVLQITVDQLRGDLPWRHMDQFDKGGFRYLADKGIWYTNTAYQHANTETVVGHSSLATGHWPLAQYPRYMAWSVISGMTGAPVTSFTT